MNLSVSCLLDALRHADMRANTLRLQIDGCSDNVNYAFHCIAGLLVQLNIFQHVYLNRLDVG